MVNRRKFLIITLVMAVCGVVYPVDMNMLQEQLRENVMKLIAIKPDRYGVFDDNQLSQIQNIFNEIQRLITTGANINTPDAQGVTLLRTAVKNNNFLAVHYLLNFGADVNFKDSKDITALHSAVVNNAGPEIVIALLDKGADINAKNKQDMTPLLIAVQQWNEPLVRILVARGADKTIKTPSGKTAMQLAQDISMKPDKIGKDASLMFQFLSEKPLP